MAKRRFVSLVCLLCFTFWLLPIYGQAASTTDASEPIDLNKTCTLTLSYLCDGTAFADVEVLLYRIADVSADYQYTLCAPFATSSLEVNGLTSAREWKELQSTLEAQIVAEGIEADETVLTNGVGQVQFLSLEPGLYMAVPENGVSGELVCTFEASLIALPSLSEAGLWQYDVSVASKGEMEPSAQKEIQRKVLKLWKGDKKHPKSVEVELFRDGKSYKKVTLSEKNQWSYSWSTKVDDGNWTVVERNVPFGYTMTVNEKGNTFVITNTFVKDSDGLPSNTTKTGDTSNIMLYVILMNISGILLIVLGMIRKKSAYEETR